MTATITRGTNRPAAAARTRKAAQRTPLPGDETTPAKAPGATPRPPRKLPNLAGMAGEAPSGSRRKAEALTAVLRPFGWRVTTTTAPGDRVTLTAKRRKEVLTIVWTSGVFEYDASSYVNAGKSRKVRNVSAARKNCATSVD